VAHAFGEVCWRHGTAARAAQLGGRVLLAPRSDLRDGTLALIADPTGAVLALQKWPL